MASPLRCANSALDSCNFRPVVDAGICKLEHEGIVMEDEVVAPELVVCPPCSVSAVEVDMGRLSKAWHACLRFPRVGLCVSSRGAYVKESSSSLKSSVSASK